jgi:hypothetical protein
MNAEPLPVELLASEDARRLQDATADCKLPLAGSHAEELAAFLRELRTAEPGAAEIKPERMHPRK